MSASEYGLSIVTNPVVENCRIVSISIQFTRRGGTNASRVALVDLARQRF